MGVRELGNPLGNPLGLTKKNEPSARRPLGIGEIRVSDAPLGNGWEYMLGQTINSPALKSVYGANRVIEAVKISAGVPGLLAAPNSVAFTPDGKLLVVATSSTPFLDFYSVDGDTYTKLPLPAGMPSSSVSDVAFSPDGHHLALSSISSPNLRVYRRDGNSYTQLTIEQPSGSSARNGCLSFSGDGKFLAIGTDGGINVYLRSGDSFTKLATGINATVPSSLSFSMDGRFLVSTSQASLNSVSIWRIEGQNFIDTNLSGVPSADRLYYASKFSADSKYLALGCSQLPFVELYMFNGVTYVRVETSAQAAAAVADVEFSPGASYVVVKYSTNAGCDIYSNANGVFTLQARPPQNSLSTSSRSFARFDPSGDRLLMGVSSGVYLRSYGSAQNVMLPIIPGMQIKVS